MSDQPDAFEIVCPNCKHTEILYIPKEKMPKCPDCGTRMIVREPLKDGKSN